MQTLFWSPLRCRHFYITWLCLWLNCHKPLEVLQLLTSYIWLRLENEIKMDISTFEIQVVVCFYIFTKILASWEVRVQSWSFLFWPGNEVQSISIYPSLSWCSRISQLFLCWAPCRFAGWQKQLGLLSQEHWWNDQWSWRTKVEWQTGESWLRLMTKSHTGQRMKAGILCFFFKTGGTERVGTTLVSMTTHITLCLALRTVGQRAPHTWNTARTGCDWFSEFEVGEGWSWHEDLVCLLSDERRTASGRERPTVMDEQIDECYKKNLSNNIKQSDLTLHCSV